MKPQKVNNVNDGESISWKGRFLESGALRASLYRNKLRKVSADPDDPLTNPYRMSSHDQMPIRVMPSPAVSTEKTSSRRRSVATFMESGKLKSKFVAVENLRQAAQTENIHLLEESNACRFVKPQNRTFSFDNLVQKPHYLTRNALKRIKEEDKLEDLNESSFSLSSNEGNQTVDFTSNTGVRSSKSRKSFHRFNLFSKASKVKSSSELTLHEVRSYENPASTETTAATRDQDGKIKLRKRRLSGFRSRFQKKLPDDSIDTKERRGKRKSKNTMSNEDKVDSLTLHGVLTNRDLCEEFQDFLASEHSDENLDFWRMCEKFKTSRNLTNLAEVICRQFLHSGAPKEVNLDAKTRTVLEENTRVLTNKSFLAAQESIYRLMEEDSFRRFAAARRSKRRKRC